MNSENNISPDLGYWFEPPEDPNAPGGNRLKINLRENPSSQHFDPAQVEFLSDSGGDKEDLENLKVYHPWPYETKYTVYAGKVRIKAKKGKIEVFTFGGHLEIVAQEDHTHCVLTSTAPLLRTEDKETIPEMFIEECEILLAERRAARLAQPHLYKEHISTADPLLLYLAILRELDKRFMNYPRKDVLHINKFLNYLHSEQDRLETAGMVPLYQPELDKLL